MVLKTSLRLRRPRLPRAISATRRMGKRRNFLRFIDVMGMNSDVAMTSKINDNPVWSFPYVLQADDFRDVCI